jgi:two-component sensor histidine kinase
MDSTGQVRLEVCDNGVGLPADMNWQQSTSLGLRFVEMLTNQVRGKLEHRTENGEDWPEIRNWKWGATKP